MILQKDTDSNNHSLDVKEELDSIFSKISRKNKQLSHTIWNKITEIQCNPHHKYKFLRSNLKKFQRVHIGKSFVLIFSINHEEKTIELWWFAHHDKAYKWQPEQEK